MKKCSRIWSPQAWGLRSYATTSHASSSVRAIVVVWTRAAVDTALWFVCLAKRADEPIIAALLDVVHKTWNLDAAAEETSATVSA